ncbi:MAG: hypothetical protein JO122_20240 [Acetobacteraceae bacterium]|nr:hypothetical protein [Acetobacteraceae bacterium]
MARRSRDTRAILRTIERSEQRSSLFWWMVDHHDEMVAATKRRRINWASFCAEAAKRNLRDTQGNPPSESAGRKTWQRARKWVAAMRAAEAANPPPRPGSVYPSRMPKVWKPEAFRTSHAAESHPGAALAPAAPVASAPVSEPDENEPYDWRKRLAELRQTINARSGRT